MPQDPRFPLMMGDHRLLVSQDPLLRQDELATRLKPLYPGRVGVFDLSDPKQMERYAEVIDRAGRGEFILCREEINWSGKTNSYVVFARWIEQQMEVLPPEAVLMKGGPNVAGLVNQ